MMLVAIQCQNKEEDVGIIQSVSTNRNLKSVNHAELQTGNMSQGVEWHSSGFWYVSFGIFYGQASWLPISLPTSPFCSSYNCFLQPRSNIPELLFL